MTFLEVGYMYLHETPQDRTDEIELKVIGLDQEDTAIFTSLEVLRFSWREKGTIQELGGRKTNPKGVDPAWKPQERGQRQQQVQQQQHGVIPMFFHSRLMNEQVLATPSWVTNPSFYDPCETEGVVHDMARCGLSPAYFV